MFYGLFIFAIEDFHTKCSCVCVRGGLTASLGDEDLGPQLDKFKMLDFNLFTNYNSTVLLFESDDLGSGE